MGILIIIEGKNKGATYKLGERVLTIGRGTANLIQLLDRSVSRRHASIWWDKKGYRIRDLESKNGTMVNGQKIVETVLNTGDSIRVGKVVFRLIDDIENAEDYVLHPRNADHNVVSSSTITIPDIEEIMDMEVVVDIDKLARKRETELRENTSKFTAIAKGTDSTKQYLMKDILTHIQRTIDADRCMVFKLTASKKLIIHGMSFNEGLTIEQQKFPTVESVIDEVLNSLSPVKTKLSGDIFACVAVPLIGEEGPLGVLYADCMADNPRVFIEQDIDVMNIMAPAVISALENA